MPTLSRYLGAMHEIALADNADNFPLIVNNRRGANPPFYKKMRDVLHRRGRFNRVHCQRHNVSGFHISLLRGILVSRTAVLLIVPGERTRIDLAQKNTAHVQSARSCVIWSGVRSTPVPLASCRPVCSTRIRPPACRRGANAAISLDLGHLPSGTLDTG